MTKNGHSRAEIEDAVKLETGFTLHRSTYFDIKRNDIKEFNRRVFETAQKYFDFLRDTRYVEFIKYIRISYIESKIQNKK